MPVLRYELDITLTSGVYKLGLVVDPDQPYRGTRIISPFRIGAGSAEPEERLLSPVEVTVEVGLVPAS